MAATIVIEQGQGGVAVDRTPKAEQKGEKTVKTTKRKRIKETIQERAVRRKIVTPDQETITNVRNKTDPYEGHGDVPDELQRCWEEAISKERERKRRLAEYTSAQQRMQELRVRIQGKREHSKNLAEYIEEQRHQLNIQERAFQSRNKGISTAHESDPRIGYDHPRIT